MKSKGGLIFNGIICYKCRSNQTHPGRGGYSNWYYRLGKDKPLCKVCYNTLFRTKKYRERDPNKWKEYNKRYLRAYMSQMFAYKGKMISGFRALTGNCSQCSNNIHDGSCKRTSMHHNQYFIIFRWFGRVELCNSCHSKKHGLGKKLL